MCLCGDFNINLLNYNYNNYTKTFVDHLFTSSLFPLINKPTHITRDCSSIIDNIFNNVISDKVSYGLILDDVSDHLPIFSMGSLFIKRNYENKILFRRKKNEDSLHNFNLRLSQENWYWVFNPRDVCDSYDKFIDFFCKHYDHCCPVKRVVCKGKSQISHGLQMSWRMHVGRKIICM